jgi:hypothetical protein
MWEHRKAIKNSDKRFSELGEFDHERYCQAIFERMTRGVGGKNFFLQFISLGEMDKIIADDMTVIQSVDMAMDNFYNQELAAA